MDESTRQRLQQVKRYKVLAEDLIRMHESFDNAPAMTNKMNRDEENVSMSPSAIFFKIDMKSSLLDTSTAGGEVTSPLHILTKQVITMSTRKN